MMMMTTFLVLTASALATAGPCDIYDAAPEGTPCVAAHSTVRALYSKYSGPLYQVRRSSDNTTKDIGVLAPGGYADAKSQDAFCGSSACYIWRIYDQTAFSNHLDIAPPGGAHRAEDHPCNATKEALMVGGNKVYAAYFEGGMGYRIDKGNGTAVGDEAQTMYMVTSGVHYNNRCCFDYGNAETDNHDDGAGTMEAVYFGSAKGGLNHGGAGKGPWIMADMENALWGADVVVSNEEPINHTYVTAMVKGQSGNWWAIKGGDASAGSLKFYWNGPRAPRYSPMKKQGSIILGIGGDNSDGATGTFYEGVMTHGTASNTTDDKVQANIVSAGYGK